MSLSMESMDVLRVMIKEDRKAAAKYLKKDLLAELAKLIDKKMDDKLDYYRHRQCRLVGSLSRIRRPRPNQRHTLTWDQGPEAAGLRAARRLRLLYCHRLLGAILVGRADVEEAAPALLEAQDVGQDSQAVTDQVTLTMMVVWSSLMARTPLLSWRPRGFIGTGGRPQLSCIGNGCRAMRGLVYEPPSG